MSHHIEKAAVLIGEDYSLFLQAQYAEFVNKLERKPESPIEEMMLLGFMHGALLIWHVHIAIPGNNAEPKDGEIAMVVHVQRQFDRYRADFAVEFIDKQNGKNRRMWTVVECDGFDFHDRTREQAERDKARDRYFAEHGIAVMRFTGSEIHRAPAHCSGQVFTSYKNWLERAAD